MTTIPVRSIMCIFSNIIPSFWGNNKAENDPSDQKAARGNAQSSQDFLALNLVVIRNPDNVYINCIYNLVYYCFLL